MIISMLDNSDGNSDFLLILPKGIWLENHIKD